MWRGLTLSIPVFCVAGAVACAQVAGGAHAAGRGPESPFSAPVVEARPRIFIRADDFEGLTVQKLRAAAGRAEFAAARAKWRARPLGRALLWMIEGSAEHRDAALAGLRRMDAQGGSWSDRGLALVELAALFDWMYAELDAAARREVVAKIEKAADDAAAHIRGGHAPFFYSRTPGALAGLGVAGLALKGASAKADGYLALVRDWGVAEYFKAYEWLDGAATGGTYTFFYTYVDLPALCAAWWSATGRNPADWIARNQGDWLGGIVRFYLWYMRPGFAFTDANDQSRDIWGTHDQFCQGLDVAAYVTRCGYGRAWSERWSAKFGSALYHSEYAHNFMFRAAAPAARPLTELPLAALFGRESCGYGFFRSAWPEDGKPDAATHVFFRCGDPVDVHGGVSAGEFQVFRYAPLAGRSGRYSSYDSPADQYHRNCISTNVVLFTDPAVAGDRGDQNTRRGLKDDHRTWDEWLQIRRRCGLDVARILEWRAGPDEARCRADLSATSPSAKCKLWQREFVWLARKHLVVLDIVETARPDVRREWQLHLPALPQVGDWLLTVTNRPPASRWVEPALQPQAEEGRLFCRTLLPRDYTLIVHSDGKAEAFAPDGRALGPAAGNEYHLKFGGKVVQVDPGCESARTVFLHVLTAVDAGETAPPDAGFRLAAPGRLEVTVDGARAVLAVPEWLRQ